MKRVEGGIQYSTFETIMGARFFQLYGGSNLALEDQEYWDDIQQLQKLAIEENAVRRCPRCGGELLGGER